MLKVIDPGTTFPLAPTKYDIGAAVAQEVEWLSANRKVAGSIPGLHLDKCGGVPEQDT